MIADGHSEKVDRERPKVVISCDCGAVQLAELARRKQGP